MKGQTKAKLIVFFIIATIAFIISSVVASIIIIDNPNNDTLPAIEDDNFTAQKVNYVPTHIQEEEEPEIINNTTIENNTNDTNITEIINDTKENLTDLWNNYSNW